MDRTTELRDSMAAPRPTRPSERVITSTGQNIVYTCPSTGMNVQHWLDDAAPGASGATEDHARDETRDQAYVSMPCPACGSHHFVNSRTGKLLVHSGRFGHPARPPAHSERPDPSRPRT